jgi:hypothetical protein
MTEQFDERFTRQDILERFRKLFGREMTPVEREAFFLPQENEEKAGD